MPIKVKVTVEADAELLINKFADAVLHIPEQNINVELDTLMIAQPKNWSEDEATYCLNSDPPLYTTCGAVRKLLAELKEKDEHKTS